MRRYISIFLYAFLLSSCEQSDQPKVTLVIPLQHLAMNDIQEGFVSSLKSSHPDCHVDVCNAMGDPTLMQSILRTAASQNVDYVATIGVSLTTAAQKICPEQKIIGVAAYKELADDRTYVVEDEVGVESLHDSLRTILPEVKKVTLIHAQDDKILKEVKAFEVKALSSGLDVQILPVLNANDLQTVCLHIQGEAVLILKDHTVVSGLQVVLNHTKKLNIPLVCSDEGSVRYGAAYAFAVSERDVGSQSGEVVAKLISQQKVSNVTKIKPMFIVNDQTPQFLINRMSQQKDTTIHMVERIEKD